MNQACPECKQSLAEFAVSCERCGWSLTQAIRQQAVTAGPKNDLMTGYDLHYQSAFDAIESGDFETAFRSIARAMNNATAQQQCETLALRGYAHLKKNEFAAAENDCTEAIKTGWTDGRTFAWRAAARCGLKKYHLAFDDLTSAIEFANGDSDTFQPMMNGFLNQARDYYADYLKNHPQDANGFWQRGWVYLRALILDKAERDFVSALKLDDKCGWSWIGLAILKLDRGLPEDAVKCATKAIHDKSPEVVRAALAIRAKAWAEVDGAEACHDDLERLGELAGNSSEHILEIAQLKFKLGLYAATVSDCDTLIRISGDNIQCRLLRGSALSRIGNAKLALKDLSQFVHAFPNHCVGLTERGIALFTLNESERALTDFSAALKEQPRYVPAYLGKARTYLLRRQLELANAAVEKAIALEERNYEGYEVRGQIRNAGNDYQSAVEDYSKAIELSRQPELKAGSFFLRGTTYYEIGQFDLARSDFETASLLRPHHAGNWIWLAAVDARREQWSAAIHSLQRAIASRPGSAKQYMTLGRPVAEKCVKHLTQQIQRGNEDPALLRDRGMAYQFLGETHNAIADYNSVLNQVDADLETRVRRGQLLQKLGQHAEAVRDFSFVIHRDKIHHLVRYYRALSLFLSGNYSHAMSDVLKALKLSPREARYHLLRGEMVQREGRLKRAVRCFDRAISLDSKDPAARRLKGLALMELNALDMAMSELNRAVEMAPENADGYAARGQFYLRIQHFDEAFREFDRAIACNPQHLKAYLGRSSVLIAQERFHETVLWLTKSLHRFPENRPMAEILLKRGKAFYQMGLSAFAINDFSAALKILNATDERAAAQARYARALAWIQAGEIESAKHDLHKLDRKHPEKFRTLRRLLSWLDNRDTSPPPEVFQPDKMSKIAKPKVVSKAIKRIDDNGTWTVKPPFDTWIVKVNDHEFGPVNKQTLDRWLEQGRLAPGMKVMRGDWSRWKHIEKVYRELLSQEG